MKDLRCVTLHFYFKIIDADIFGGEGTEGYATTSSGECIGSSNKTFDEMVSREGFNKICDAYRELLSGQMDVPVENIIPISRDEYKENIEEDEE